MLVCEAGSVRTPTQRDEYHKTILLVRSQVDEWQTMNRTALVNAAKDGVEYFTG